MKPPRAIPFPVLDSSSLYRITCLSSLRVLFVDTEAKAAEVLALIVFSGHAGRVDFQGSTILRGKP